MLVVRKDQSVRVTVQLLSGGSPVTGMTPANLNDSVTAGAVGLVKSDGSASSLAMTNGVNWIEVDSGRFPGVYHIVLASTETDLAGVLELGVRANAAEFDHTIVTVTVEEFYLSAKVLKNGWKIESTGPDANRLVIYDDDDVTSLMKFDLKDVDGNPTIASPFERVKV